MGRGVDRERLGSPAPARRRRPRAREVAPRHPRDRLGGRLPDDHARELAVRARRRARRRRSARRRLRDADRRAELQHDAHRLALRGPPVRGRGLDARLPVRLVAAGEPRGREHDRRRRDRRRDRLRRRDDEPGRDRLEHEGGPRARIRGQVLVGTDPYFHIEGPIDATRALLARSGMTIDDVDVFEINEAFASVVLSWRRAFDADPEKLNRNGAASFAGTHSVPLNWHSKPGEIEHVLSDSGATHLVVHADLLRPIADSVPPDVAVLCVPTPPEVRRAYGTALDEAVPPPGYPVWDRWLRRHPPLGERSAPAGWTMFYTSGTTGRPKGVRRERLAGAARERFGRLTPEWFGFEPGSRTAIVGPLYHSVQISYVTAAARARAVIHLLPRIDDDAGNPLPPYAEGEVYVSLGALPDFTYQNAEHERAAIERDGLITNGDVGYLDEDGYLYLVDRKRDVIISGGVNVYPAEIEAAAAEHPSVRDCVVFGVPDDEFGEVPLAVVEPRPGATVSDEELRALLRGSLASFKVPRTVEVTNALPRDESGKISKRALREPYWAGTGRRI